MMRLFRLTYNPFQVNTYILADDDGEAFVVDPGMYEPDEFKAFDQLIKEEGLHLQALINTHGHVDHILGNDYVRETYQVPLWTHQDSVPFLEHAAEHAAVYGLEVSKPGLPDKYIDEGDILYLGQHEIKIILCPGHANGSICLHIPDGKILIAGDVLFNGSIGRTDLPTGNMEVLLRNIREKLMVLEPDTRVLPGHGNKTTIGFEKKTNPFLQ